MLSAAEWKTMLPAQMASSCWTTKGWARNRFDWARIAISKVDIRATLGCGLALFGCSQAKFPTPPATSP